MWLLYVCMLCTSCHHIKFLSKNIIPKGFGQMLPIMVYDS